MLDVDLPTILYTLHSTPFYKYLVCNNLASQACNITLILYIVEVVLELYLLSFIMNNKD